MKILQISGHLPSPRATQAGSKTSYHMARCLSERHEVHLLSYASSDELVTHVDSDLCIYSSSEIVPVSDWVRLKGILSAPNLPIAIAARKSRKFRTCLRKLLAQHQFDIAILDYTAQFQYHDELLQVPIIVGSAHDIMTQGWERKSQAAQNPVSKMWLSFELRRMRKWEAMIFERLDVVVPQSPKDGELVARLQPKVQVFVIQGWLSRAEALRARDGDAARVSNSMVYYGALNRTENIDAAEYLADEILPLVQRQIPEAKLYLAGSHGEKLAARFAARPDIRVTGFLQDPIGFLATMQIALLPLRLGAGIKAKTLECLSAGTPVVTTDVGAEGVGGCVDRDYLVANDSDGLASHAVDLLRNPEKALAIGSSGRDFFFREYNFDHRIRELDLYMEDLVKNKRGNEGAHATHSQECVHESIER